MVDYYKDKCDFCGKKGHKIARIYWRKIGFTWKHLCKKCWDIQERNLVKKKEIEQVR